MATKKKYQSGGPADAMRKAMGQKPTSTKETLKYVRKNGSGYIPPAKSDTVKPKAQKGTIVGEEYKRSTPFQDYLKNNKGAVPSDTVGKSVAGKPNMGYYSSANPKNEKALSKAIDKTYSKKKIGGATKSTYESGGAVKPKAQLGKIVKMADKAIDAGKAVKKVSKAPLDFRKISTRTDVSDAFKQAERARLKKMLQDADKARDKKQTGGATSKKKLINVNTIPAAKNKFTAPTKRPMMAKMGGMTKKKC